VIGGFSDWYMPAKNELEVCYFNLKPTTTSNNTSSGINPNAVPARASNYTGGLEILPKPQQQLFKQAGQKRFTAGYWSSTEFSATNARPQWFFYNGYQAPTYGY
jgi:hypothetical protein